MKTLVGAFNQEKALVGAFSVIVKPMDRFTALVVTRCLCQDLPGYENYTNHQLQELSYSSDRNYFCQPYIGFVPESQEFKNVRKEMVRYSNKSAKVSTSILNIFIFSL